MGEKIGARKAGARNLDDDIFFGIDDDGSPTRSEDDTRKKKPKKPIAKPYNLETIVSGDSEFEEIMNSKEPSRPKQASRKGRSNAPPNSASKQNTSSSGKRTAKVQKSGGPESDIDSSDNSPRPRKHKPALNKVTTKHTSDLRKSKQSGGVPKQPNHKSHLDSRGKSRGRTGTKSVNYFIFNLFTNSHRVACVSRSNPTGF